MTKLRDLNTAQDRRQFLETELDIRLDYIDSSVFTEDDVVGRNIENLIGSTQIPLGVAGPLAMENGKWKMENCYVPLATTEGGLVASISRGCKAINISGGATTATEYVGITRGPVFQTTGIRQSLKLKFWILDHFDLLVTEAVKTSSHIKLLKVAFSISGKKVFTRFYFDTDGAMGMNMATIATSAIIKKIEQETSTKCVTVAGNFDIDKKPSWLNFLLGRGWRVWAEVTLKKQTVVEVLKTTPEKIDQIVKDKCLLGSAVSGAMGFNAHYANIIAAIFIATGQDPAHIVEGSLGITSSEILSNGDLYFSIYLPDLIIGAIGGGTRLPTQNSALRIMGIDLPEKIDIFASIIASSVLAGELSLIASLAEGSLASAHITHGRKGGK